MEISKILIYACGFYSAGLAIFHATFWKLFDWKHLLMFLNRTNRAILQVANLRLIYLFLGVGFVCFYLPEDLQGTLLGNVFLVGMSGFFAGRTIEQFIFFRINHWMVHILTALFIVGIIIFLLPVLL